MLLFNSCFFLMLKSKPLAFQGIANFDILFYFISRIPTKTIGPENNIAFF